MEPSPAQRAARDRIAAGLAAGGLRPARHPDRPRLRLRQAELPLPRRPAPAARPLRRMDPQDRRQDRRPAGSPPRELAEYQPLFDNAKKLRALLAELQDLTLEIIEAGSPRAARTRNRRQHLRKTWADPA